MIRPQRAVDAVAAASAVVLVLWLPTMAAAQDGCGSSYTVSAGDTLAAIAGRCDTSVEALMQANPVIETPGRISIGWELTIPGAQASLGPEADVRPPARDEAAEAALAEGSYDVQPGDSFASIATALQIPMRDLMAANPRVDPFSLQSGQTLTLPEGRSADSPDADGSAGEGPAAGRPADGPPDTGDGAAAQTHGEPVGTGGGDRAPDDSTASAPPAAAAGRLTLEGHVREGAECPVLQTPQGETYSLVSAEYAFAPGEYVEIEGEALDLSFCGSDRTTVRVTSMTARAPQGG